jgi:hypothetical protein
MRITRAWPGIALVVCVAATVAQEKKQPIGYSDTPVLPGQKWKVHDIDRPRPRWVDPGPAPASPAPVTADAVVLFDGKDLSHFVREDRPDQPAGWKVANGYMEVVPKTGSIMSKEKFGDAQFHVEWAAPSVVRSNSQGRGNSGFIIMKRYEIQILDSYENPSYADGQAASIYGQFPPLVNASRRPGEWQTYDIIFKAPRFENGKLVSPAYITVIHNGIVVHHHQNSLGTMQHRVVATYQPHDPEDSLVIQNHGDPVRFRSIWVRRLGNYDEK